MGLGQKYAQQDVLERNILHVLASTKHVFLFDHATLVPMVIDEIGGYDPVYQELAQRTGHELYEFEAARISEQHLLDQLLDSTIVHSRKSGKFDDQVGSDASCFQRLCALMKAERSGMIGIHNAQFISKSGVDLLSRLGSYLKRHNLKWKILIFANEKGLDDSVVTRLGIEEFYAQSILGPVLKKSAESENKHKTHRHRHRLAKLAIGLGILVLVVVLITGFI